MQLETYIGNCNLLHCYFSYKNDQMLCAGHVVHCEQQYRTTYAANSLMFTYCIPTNSDAFVSG